MNASKRPYVITLIVAVIALVGSVAVAVAYQGHRVGSSVAVSPGWGNGMMGGGMMGGYDDTTDNGGTSIDATQAQSLAQAWVDKNAPGATLDAPATMPMGYLYTVTRDNTVIAQIVVNARTGSITVRTWATPSPSTTG